MAIIFISHSSKDKVFARKLATELGNVGHQPWLDEAQIQVGDCIVSALQRGLAESEYVVLVVTPESVASGWVDREWKAAYWSDANDKRRKLLPVLLRRCEIPQFLAGVRYADFTLDFASGFSALVGALCGEAVAPVHKQHDATKRLATLQECPSDIVSIRIELTSEGRILEAEVATSLTVTELKREIMLSQGYSDQFLDGRVAETNLYSKTRKVYLDNFRTVEENGVQDGEVIRLHFSCDAG